MPKNRKKNSKKNRKADATYSSLTDAPLQAVSAEEVAFLSSLSAEELNALIDGRADAARGI